MKTFELEYFDREHNYVGIDTFIIINDNIILPGQKFLGFDYINPKKCRCPKEGRIESLGYGLPLLIDYKSRSGTHIISRDYGSIHKELSFMTYEDYYNNTFVRAK